MINETNNGALIDKTELSKIVDTRAIKKAFSSAGKSSNYMESISKKHGLDQLIKVIKVSGVLVEKYPDTKNKKIHAKVIEYLKNTYPTEEKVEQFLIETELFQTLYHKLNAEIHAHSKTMPTNALLGAYMLAIESFYSANSPAYLGLDNQAESLYEIQRFINAEFKNLPLQEQANREKQAMILEEGMTSLQHCLRFLDKKYGQIDLGFNYDKNIIQNALKYLQFSEIKRTLDNIYEYWLYLDATLKVDNNNILVTINNITSYTAWYLANTRKTRAHNSAGLLQRTKKVKINKSTQVLPPKEFDSLGEYSSCFNIVATFYESLDSNYLGIPLNVWMRAYSNLRKLSRKILLSRLKSENLYGNFTLLLQPKKKEEWCRLLAGRGVSRTQAAKIFDCWVFNGDKSFPRADLLEQPFYRVADYQYILFASLGHIISPAACMIKLFNGIGEINKKANKGLGFERVCESTFKQFKIPFIKNIKLYDSEKNKEAEYDFLFKIDDDIYVAECKSKLDLFHFDEHHNFYSEIKHHHIPKLNRNFELLIDRLDELKTRFTDSEHADFFKTNKQLNFKKLILTSVRLGEPLHSKDCSITDLDNLFDVFENKDIDLNDINMRDDKLSSTGYKKVMCIQKALDLPLNERLKVGLKKPRTVHLLKNFFEITQYEEQMLGFKFQIPQANVNIPDMFYA